MSIALHLDGDEPLLAVARGHITTMQWVVLLSLDLRDLRGQEPGYPRPVGLGEPAAAGLEPAVTCLQVPSAPVGVMDDGDRHHGAHLAKKSPYMITEFIIGNNHFLSSHFKYGELFGN